MILAVHKPPSNPRPFKIKWASDATKNSRKHEIIIKAADALAAIRQGRTSGRVPGYATVVHVELVA